MQRFNASHYQFPAPQNSDDFESLCLDLFRKIWGDSYAKKNGRNGQGQKGVDIVSSLLPGQGYIGVQCKKKDLSLNSALTPKEVDGEIKLAEDFKPKLSRLIIASTDIKDVSLEEHIRLLSEERSQKGLFLVDLFCWPDLVSHIGNYSDVAEKHSPPGWRESKTQPASDAIRKTDGEAIAASAEGNAGQIVNENNTQLQASSALIAITTKITDEYHQEINVSKQLLEQYKYTEALHYLERLKERIWHTADISVRFRVLTNIASAQYHLEQPVEAARNFLEAYKLNPTDSKAETNKAFAYLLTKAYEKALQYADELLKINPLNASAAAIKIQAMSHLHKSYDMIKESFDEALKDDTQIVYSLSFAARQADQLDETIKLLEKALELDKEHDPNILADLATNLLYRVINQDPPAIHGMLDSKQYSTVQRAVLLLDEAWQQLTNNEDRKHASVWLYNMVTAHRLLGNNIEAEKFNNELMRLHPEKHEYIKNAAALAFAMQRPAVAEGLLRNLISQGTTLPEVSVMLADALYTQEKQKQALKILNDFLKTYRIRDSLWLDANELAFGIRMQQSQVKEAQAIIDRLAQEAETTILAFILSAKLSRYKQDSAQATEFLLKAEKGVTKDTYPKLVIDIAEEAYLAQAYELAARTYTKVINPTTDTPLTRRYLQSLYETKQYQKILEITSDLRKAYGAIKEITQFEWASYLELQDLPNAKKVLNQYIKANPSDEVAKLRLAIINIRSNDLKAVDTYLAKNIDCSSLDLFSSIQLANLHQMRGKPEKALEIVYDVRRRYPDSPDAHSGYISLFFTLEESLRGQLNTEVVGPNTAIIYDGGYFIVEDTCTPTPSHNELSAKEANIRGFIGKRAGDTIILSKSYIGGETEAEIATVQSKYVFALQESMLNFERRFSSRKDIVGIKIKDDNIQPILKQLDEDYDHTKRVEGLYKDGKLTIDLFAKLIGKGIIPLFYALRAMPDLGVMVALGSELESTEALHALAQYPTVVVDITALITLYELGLDPSKIGINKLVIAQSTKDAILEELTKMRGIEKQGRMSIYKDKDKYIHYEVSAKEQLQQITRFEKFAAWVDKHGKVESITQQQVDAIESKRPEQLEEIIDDGLIDTIKLASGEKRVFYSDDLALRSIVKSIFGINGVWTQLLLSSQADHGKLESEVYEEASIKLTQANYYHTRVNAQIVLRAAKQANWLPDEPLTSVLQALTGKTVDIQSMIVVLINFLYEFYKQPIRTNESYIVQEVLSEATRHHDAKMVLPMLERGIDMRFKLSPIHANELKQIIVSWRLLRGL